ncbi:hypothetical protein OEA41_002354 [Lepraria neglecta]|uniref:F-box domain-containing protein n=1 Tax=Lepraria neglecta TaxID=209136 RepID=A0AAD9ZEN5_9LECA|nr:hypothetical protein OEA41_002354 [Lepraria neglecta]
MPGDELARASLTSRSYRDLLVGASSTPRFTAKVDSHDQPVLHGLRALPTEILVEILKHIPSFDCLYNLLILLPTGRAILKSFVRNIFNAVFRTSRKYQLARQIYVVMVIRNRRPNLPMTRNYFHHLLDADEPDAILRRLCKPSGAPMATLRDISDVSDSIEILVKDFAHSRIAIPSKEPDDSISPTELCRIRRAFWRFQLCYELSGSREPSAAPARQQSPPCRSPLPTRFVWPQTSFRAGPCISQAWLNGRGETAREIEVERFLQTLSIWEIAEFEAVRSHLASVVNTLQYRRSTTGFDGVHEQPVLIQRLMHDLRNWNLDGADEEDHLLVANLRMVRHPAGVGKYWLENGEANFANSTTTQRSRLSTRYNDKDEHWGWCMWDVERLIRRGLLLEPGPEASSAKAECDSARDTFIYEWVTKKRKRDREIEELRDREKARKERELVEEAAIKYKARRKIEILKGWIKKRNPNRFNLWIESRRRLVDFPDEKEAERTVARCHETVWRMKEHEEKSGKGLSKKILPKLSIRSAQKPSRFRKLLGNFERR